MNLSKKKFILLFIISGSAFLAVTTSFLGTTGPRGFPKPPDSLLLLESGVAWKRAVSTMLVPVKIVLIGPLLLPNVNFLKEDPPPPFVALYFIFYWSLLALLLHYSFGRMKRS